jgi:hypothetical protein
MSHLDELQNVMDLLEKEGYFILKGSTCCRSCADGFFAHKYPDLTDESKRVFYTEQSMDGIDAEGNFKSPMHLYWRGDIKGQELLTSLVLYADDLIPSWQGTEDYAMVLTPKFLSNATSSWLGEDEEEYDDDEDWYEDEEEEEDDD